MFHNIHKHEKMNANLYNAGNVSNTDDKKPHKAWAFTCNNYTDDDIDILNKLEGVTRMVYGREKGERGTPHLQGTVVFKMTYRFNKLNQVLKRFHIGICRSVDHSWNYCLKDLDYTVIDNRAQGSRTDIVKYKDMVKNGASEYDLADQHPALFLKYGRVNAMRLAFQKKRAMDWRDVEVVVLYGKSGTGKTRTARKNKYDVFLKGTNTGKWWDGYDGETEIILDEFKGQMSPQQLIHLIDGHPTQIQVKGGIRWALWTKVWITSQLHPDEWWMNAFYRIDPEEMVAVKRRFSQVIHFGGYSEISLGERIQQQNGKGLIKAGDKVIDLEKFGGIESDTETEVAKGNTMVSQHYKILN